MPLIWFESVDVLMACDCSLLTLKSLHRTWALKGNNFRRRKDISFHRKGLSKAGDSSLRPIKTDFLGRLGSRVISDFISIIVGGTYSIIYWSIQMAAAVSRAFDMVFTGLSYTGNNSAGKMHGTGQTDGWLCTYP